MITELTADWVFRDVCQMTPEWLCEQGIKAVITDLDNTLAGYSVLEPGQQVGEWIAAIRQKGISIMVLSNNNERRVGAFCNPLGIPYMAKSGKPKPDGILYALNKLGVRPEEAVMVGDQVFTDVRAGKRARVRVALVAPVTTNLLFRLRRLAERPFIRAAEKNRRP